MKKLVNKDKKVKGFIAKIWEKSVDLFIDLLMKNENQIMAEAELYTRFTDKILGKF